MQLSPAPSQHAGRSWVDIGDKAIRVQRIETFGHVVHDYLAESDCLFAFGNVHDDVADADYLAVYPHRVEAGQEVGHLSVHAGATQHDVGDVLARQRPAVDILEFGPQIRNRFGDSASNLFRNSPAVDVGQPLVDPHDPEIVIDQLESDRSRVSDGLQKA